MGVQRYCYFALSILYSFDIFDSSATNMINITDIGFDNVRGFGIFKVFKTFGFVMCARECEQTEMCTGFNFGTSLLLCELLISTTDTENENGWRFVNNVTWLQEKGLSKISGSRACKCNGKNIKLSSDKFFCQDCNMSLPIDCADVTGIQHYLQNGVYRIEPIRKMAIDVYCDMEAGGWTVFQRRIDGTVDFYRNWDDYKNGFGNVGREHWMGNEKLHHMLSVHDYKLRIDMEYFNGTQFFTEYSLFHIAGEDTSYTLTVGKNAGHTGDAFTHMNKMKFSTKDRDNDLSNIKSCARKFFGGWWYTNCHRCNLNGKYYDSGHCPFGAGLIWNAEYYISLKCVSMKMKRKGAK